MSDFTHFDASGAAHMVDVGAKPATERIARAQATILMQAQTLKMIETGGHKKGDVLGVARLAGIMAAKKTADLIPLCHPLALSSVKIAFETRADPPAVIATTTVKTTGPTGVEMEALTAASVTGLTIIDMCKAIDKEMTITDLCMTYKSGGKSGTFSRDGQS